jgi:hypothetical protein
VSGALSINSKNDITLTGRFTSTVDFDPGPAVVSHTANQVDLFVLQLSPSGNLNWVKPLVGLFTTGVQADDLLHDKNDNILVTGFFFDTIDVDPGPATHYWVDDSSQNADYFLLKLDMNGNYLWSKQFVNMTV